MENIEDVITEINAVLLRLREILVDAELSRKQAEEEQKTLKDRAVVAAQWINDHHIATKVDKETGLYSLSEKEN